MTPLLEPKEIEVSLIGGGTKTFVISKFPAVAGREIVTQYPVTATPKVGDYRANEELMLKLLSYVAVPVNSSEPLRLSTQALIDNHVPDYEALMRLEFAMMEYNTSFFTNGKASNFFQGLLTKVQTSALQMLTQWSQQSSGKK